MNTDRKEIQYRAFWAQTCKDSYHRLISAARRLAPNNAYEAEDLAQETVCRALTYSKNPKEISNPFGYLLRVMRNVWIDKRVHEHRETTESLDELLNSDRARFSEPAIEPDILRILENEELMARMKVMKGPLTKREWLLLKLYLEGFSCEEIAAKLDEDVRLTRSDLNAVRTKVRYRLQNKFKAKTKGSSLGRTHLKFKQ